MNVPSAYSFSVDTGSGTAPVPGNVMEWTADRGGWPGPKAAPETSIGEQLTTEVVKSGPLIASFPWFLPYFDPEQSLFENSVMRLAYRRMLSDPDVKAALLGKLLAVAARDLKVIPAGKGQTLSKQLQMKYGREADFLGWNLEQGVKGGMPGLLWNVLIHGAVDGYSLCEKVWGHKDKGEWQGSYYLRAAKPKDVNRDVIPLTDPFRNVTGWRGLRYNSGQEFHPSHFIHYVHQPLFDTPTGVSDFRACYGAWWFKKTCETLRVVGLEKKSYPLLWANYAVQGQAPSIEKALANARSQSFFVVPPDVMVNALDVAGSAQADFEQAIANWTHKIFLSIAGAILQQLEGTTSSGRGDSQVHQNSSELRIWHLCSAVEALLNDEETGLVPEVIDLNFVTDRYPKLTLGGIDADEQMRALDKKTKLHALGYPLSKKALSNEFEEELPDPDDPDDVLPGQGGGGGAAQPPPGNPPGGSGGGGGGDYDRTPADDSDAPPEYFDSFAEARRKRQDGESSRDLASLLAGILTALEAADEDTEEDAADAEEELRGSGWRVERNEDGEWEAVEDDEDEDPEKFAERHKDGDEWETRGRKYRREGGKTVRIGSGRDVRPVKERIAERASKGSVDRAALASRLSKHRGEHPPSASARGDASRAARAFGRHHGKEGAAHRIEELTDRLESALEGVQGDDWRAERKRDLIRAQLRQLSHAHEALGRHEEEARAKQKPPTDTGSDKEVAASLKRAIDSGKSWQGVSGARAALESGSPADRLAALENAVDKVSWQGIHDARGVIERAKQKKPAEKKEPEKVKETPKATDPLAVERVEGVATWDSPAVTYRVAGRSFNSKADAERHAKRFRDTAAHAKHQAEEARQYVAEIQGDWRKRQDATYQRQIEDVGRQADRLERLSDAASKADPASLPKLRDALDKLIEKGAAGKGSPGDAEADALVNEATRFTGIDPRGVRWVDGVPQQKAEQETGAGKAEGGTATPGDQADEPHQMTRADFAKHVWAHGTPKKEAVEGIAKSGWQRGEFAPPEQQKRGISYGWDKRGLNALEAMQMSRGEKPIPPERHGAVFFGRRTREGEKSDHPHAPLKMLGHLPYADAAKDPHRAFVAAALAAGKSVPPEVLADYPDLAAPKKETQPTPQAVEDSVLKHTAAIAAASPSEAATVPEVVDALQKDHPGMTREQAHQELLRMEDEGKIFLGSVNDVHLEPRAGEMIDLRATPRRGLLGYVNVPKKHAEGGDWDESKVKRDKGQFATKEGGGGGKSGKKETDAHEAGDAMKPLASDQQIAKRTKEAAPRQIRPVNLAGKRLGPHSERLIDEIAVSMEKDGWQGPPLLVMKDEDVWQGLTGSHRLAAAEKVGIGVPVVFVSADDVRAWMQKAGYDPDTSAGLTDLDDEDRLKILAAGDDDVAKEIMRQEVQK